MQRVMRTSPTYLGTAGWSLPRATQSAFPGEGSHLARYAARFNAVEINSTFYRPHRASTFARWSNTVPASFHFSVKIPRIITHERHLADSAALLDDFLMSLAPLGGKLAALLVQLPPSLAFDAAVVEEFLRAVRQRFDRAILVEPRHVTWFNDAVDELLIAHRVARVAADPACASAAADPGGWDRVVYFRLHGSPRKYYSSYSEDSLATLAQRITAATDRGAEGWCIFDNTASGAAMENALLLEQLLAATPVQRSKRRSANGG
jgi:uncharacterized protein YecE (DUF72 family)